MEMDGEQLKVYNVFKRLKGARELANKLHFRVFVRNLQFLFDELR